MGINCPICNSRQAIVKNIYGGASDSQKPSDIIAQTLACGHTIGGEEYQEFLDTCNTLESDTGEQIRKLKEACRVKKAAAWVAISKNEGDE